MFHHHESPLLHAAPNPTTNCNGTTTNLGLFMYNSNGYHPFHSSCNSSSYSPPYTYSSSLPSSLHLMRSSSSHSLSVYSHISDPTHPPTILSSSPPSSASLPEFFDFHAEPVRRVFSTGDLQGMNNGQHASVENCAREGGGVPGRVGRYTAEERKERIERYRSKRNHRNFQKKITYACRKTLADSRPRVRGRFARNGEMETEAEAETEATEVCYDEYNRHQGYQYNYYEQTEIAGGGGGGDWWRQMQAALTTEVEEDCSFDQDTWANLLDDLSMNLLS